MRVWDTWWDWYMLGSLDDKGYAFFVYREDRGF